LVWDYSPTEAIIAANIKGVTRGRLAEKLGMKESTLNTHIDRIKTKREWAKKFLRKTNHIKKELYPRRKGR
jgi:DNA-binding CsgD family transcriptional regulator